MEIPSRNSCADGKEQYIKGKARKITFLVSLTCLLVFLMFLVLYIDLKYMSFGDVMKVVFNIESEDIPLSKYTLVRNIYLPRVVGGVLAGAALGVSGAVMQCILRNPLGSPYTLGISNSAAFGAAVAIVLISESSLYALDSPYFIAFTAFTFSIISTLIIVGLVKVTKSDPMVMVLAGVAISSIFAAGISFLQYIYSADALADIVFWQFGSLGKPNWIQLEIIAVLTVTVSLYFFRNRWSYNALDNGDEIAMSLGINVETLRLLALVLCSLLTSVVVSFMGIISFIGLIAPHLVRMTMGNDHRYLIPASMIFGALILTVADCVGQNTFTATIPVGIITAFLGGPLFLYILIRGYRKKKAGGV